MQGRHDLSGLKRQQGPEAGVKTRSGRKWEGSTALRSGGKSQAQRHHGGNLHRQARSGDPLPKLGKSQSKGEENHGPGRNKEPQRKSRGRQEWWSQDPREPGHGGTYADLKTQES